MHSAYMGPWVIEMAIRPALSTSAQEGLQQTGFNFSLVWFSNVCRNLKVPGGSTNMNRSKISGSTSQNRIGKDRNVTLGIGSRTTLNSSRKSVVGLDSKAEHHRLPGGKAHNIQVKKILCITLTLKFKSSFRVCW